METTASFTPEQIKALGLCDGNGSRSKRRLVRLYHAAIALNLLAFRSDTPYHSPFSGLFSHEIIQVLMALGIPSDNHKLAHAFRTEVSTATYANRLTRTEHADTAARQFFIAGEDAIPEGPDSGDLTPLANVIISHGTLDTIADHVKNLRIMDRERHDALDPFRSCRRLVRLIARMVGGKITVPVIGIAPTYVAIKTEAHIGTAAIDRTATILKTAIKYDRRFTKPMERYWRISKLVLETLGATVNADLDAEFDPPSASEPIETPSAAATSP